MVDLILEAGYNYVSAVHTEGNYGASGMKAFLDLSEEAGICTATELAVPQHVNIKTDPVFNMTVLELKSHKNVLEQAMFERLYLFHIRNQKN